MKIRRLHFVKKKIAMAVFLAGLGATSSQGFAQEDEPITLEELIVTATRNEESVQDVPLAVTVNSGEDLELKSVYDGTAVATLSPSINYAKTNNSFAGPTLVIRGIGTVGTGRAFEGSVGVFIDGVYRSRPGHILNTFLDVQTLQVARGPQGTLFGKNTTAGALLLETNKPVLADEVSGTYNFSAGNFGSYRAQAAINIPAGDRSAFRIAASSDDRDGFFTDLFTGRSESGGGTDAVRLSYLANPTDDVEVTITADYSKREAFCCYGIGNLEGDVLTPVVNALAGAFQGAEFPNPGGPFSRRLYLNHIAEDNTIDQGINLNLELGNVLGGSITAIVSARKWEAENIGFDGEYLPLDVLRGDFENFESDTVSAELLYNVSPTDNLELLAGLYYSQEDIQIDRQFAYGTDAQTYLDILVGVPGLAEAPSGRVITEETMLGDNQSLGVFLRGTYQFTDNLSGFAGVRWSRDEKDGSHSDLNRDRNIADATAFFAGARPSVDAFILLGLLPSLGYNETFEDDEVSFSAGLQYALSDSTSLYGSINRGYKAGGITLDINAAGGRDALFGLAPPVSPIYDSETVDNIELGAKIDWLGGTARSNIALFYNDIENLQVNQFNGLGFIVVNGGSAESAGVEIEHLQRFNEYLTFDLAATWLSKNSFGDEQVLDFLAGRELTRAPELGLNVGLNFDLPIGATINATGRLAYEWRDDHFTEATVARAEILQESYGLVNLTAGLNFVDRGFRIEAFCRNCADEDYVTVHFNQPLGAGAINGYLGDPRTYGVQFRGGF